MEGREKRMKQWTQSSWDEVLQDEWTKPYYEELREFLKKEYAEQTIYPPQDELWTAFTLTPFEEVKVVILGQDPYHGFGQAHGMSFSVKPGVKIPPSLRNMFKELSTDLGVEAPTTGTLTGWATQGVLLMNTVLTVREKIPHSHKEKGWEQLTDTVIRSLNDAPQRIVFLLWGNAAREKKALIDTSRHAVIESTHPSPFSAYRGFFGSRPFSKTNDYLIEWGQTPIDWEKSDAGWPIDR